MYKKDIITFKIMLLGDSGVGKASIINRYINNVFNDNISSTIGINFSYKEIFVNKKDKIGLKLIDTVGQEKYRALTKSYFRLADAVLFVFSMNDKDTFDTINDWMDSFKENNSRKDILKYLVGNKNDLDVEVEQSLIDEFSKENKIPFISASAKTKKNIDKLFEEIGKELYIYYFKKGIKENKQNKQNKQYVFSIKTIKKPKNKCCLTNYDM